MSEAPKNRRSRDARRPSLDTPLASKPKWYQRYRPNPESFGVMTESFARWMGTPQFLVWMTIFVTIWLSWNTLMPEGLQFDPRSLNFTLLTLMLSLQASYAAPLLLLAQNRQDDRDRVVAEEDRKRAQQNLADTEYLTREIAALRISLREVATRDFVRSEIRDLLEEIVQEDEDSSESDARDDGSRKENSRRDNTRKGGDSGRRGREADTKTSILDIVDDDGAAAGPQTGESRRGGQGSQ